MNTTQIGMDLAKTVFEIHYWGRELQGLGHRVSLLHPADVARYRDGNKTDRGDAKAVALANKLARVCWRVWRDERPFECCEAA